MTFNPERSLYPMDLGSVLVVGKVRNLIYRPQPEVDPETVIIKAHISGAYDHL